MIIGKGVDQGYLDHNEVRTIIETSLGSLRLDGKRVLVLIPDLTRTMPVPMIFDLFEELLGEKVKSLDYLVALGTHPLLNDDQLSRLVGRQVVNGQVGRTRIFNHEWHNPGKFIRLGTIQAGEVENISGGLLSREVIVQINKTIFDYDQTIICGPVFPHEVVGFSGGNKYFFPGIAGPEIINFTHWLGALITSNKVIGIPETPVRAIIERAAEFINVPVACFSFVLDHEGIAGVFCGPAKEAWQAAAKLSSVRHIIYKEKPFNKVISVMPRMYDDLWTAAKGMYKLEPVVADGGEVIIYAPHIHEVSYTHGKLIDEVGYHCRDYFLGQWEHFQGYPGGVLAHSTHLAGSGTYDAHTRHEEPRIRVTLATGIPEERCKKINLGYLAPGDLHLERWANREDEGILVVHQAGETLYRLRESI